MKTLAELLSMVEYAPPTDERKAPGWEQLKEIGGGVVERAEFPDGSFIDVYAKGYVHYFDGKHNTTFSLQDATLNYEYDNQADNRHRRKVCRESIFYECPWIIRVMLEGTNRIFFSSDLSGAEKYRTDYDSTCEDSGTYGSEVETPEVIYLRREKFRTMYESFCMITERQQYVIRESGFNGRTRKDIAEELGITHQGVSDAVKKGRRRLKKYYDEFYGDDE